MVKNYDVDIPLYSLRDNKRIIKDLFGQEIIDKSINNQIDNDLFKQLNYELSRYVYGKDISKYINDRNITALDDYYNYLYNKFLGSSIFKDIDLSDIGLVLVRPEMYCFKYNILSKIKELGFDIIYTDDLVLNIEQYITLYYHGLINKYSSNDFPTRTFNYINKKSFLIIGRLSTNGFASDYLNSFKGQPGFCDKITFRGKVVIEVLKGCVKSPNMFYNEYSVLMDPIGAYRLIVDGKVDKGTTDNHQLGADYPLLFYAGQGVHIPDSSEITRDISVICNDKSFERVFYK